MSPRYRWHRLGSGGRLTASSPVQPWTHLSFSWVKLLLGLQQRPSLSEQSKPDASAGPQSGACKGLIPGDVSPFASRRGCAPRRFAASVPGRDVPRGTSGATQPSKLSIEARIPVFGLRLCCRPPFEESLQRRSWPNSETQWCSPWPSSTPGQDTALTGDRATCLRSEVQPPTRRYPFDGATSGSIAYTLWAWRSIFIGLMTK